MKKVILLLVAISLVLGMNTANAQKKAAFLSIYETIGGIVDDDEKAAAEWFTTTYGGSFLPVSALSTTDLSQYDVIWLHVDVEDRPILPDDLLNFDVLEKITDYYKSGGNLLLTTHAVSYLACLGRIHQALPPNGPVGNGFGWDDECCAWYLSAIYGTWEENPVENVLDHSDDPLYEGLSYEMWPRPNGNEYKVFPLIGPGWKEDHNCFWHLELPAPFHFRNPLSHQYIYDTWKATPLGTWSNIEDYYGGAVMRWHSTCEYQGKCITIGIGCYEWNQNYPENPYQSNIERLTQNALDELSNTGTNTQLVINGQQIGISVNNNLLMIFGEVGKARLYDISGVKVGEYNANKLAKGVNVSSLPGGVYIVSLYDLQGEIIASKKIIK